MTTQTNVVNAVEDNKAIVINTHISAVSGTRQIDLLDLGIKVEELPAASRKLLSAQIFPPEFLRNYTRMRDQAEACVNADGAVTVPVGAVMGRPEAIKKIAELKRLKLEWQAQKDIDAPLYDQMCADHILQTVQVAVDAGDDIEQVNILTAAIIKKQPSWEMVCPKLDFAFSVTPVSLVEAAFDPELYEAQRDSVVALREGVLGALVQHVCKEAKCVLELMDKNELQGRAVVASRTLDRVRALVKKLDSLAFIHPLISPLAVAVGEFVDGFAHSTSLLGAEYISFKECLKALRDQTLVWERLNAGLPLVVVATNAPQMQLGVTAPAVAAAATTAVPAASVAPVVALAPVTTAPAVVAAQTVVAAAPAAVANSTPAPTAATAVVASVPVKQAQQTMSLFL